MRWRDREGSENVEDRREESGRRRFPFPFPRGDGEGGFPGRGLPIPTGRGGGISIVGLLVLLALMYFLGVDPREILDGGGGGPMEVDDTQITQQRPATPQEEELKSFIAVVLKTTEDIWSKQLTARGQGIHEAEAGGVPRCLSVRVRDGRGADGPVLLPAGPEDLSRSVVL